MLKSNRIPSSFGFIYILQNHNKQKRLTGRKFQERLVVKNACIFVGKDTRTVTVSCLNRWKPFEENVKDERKGMSDKEVDDVEESDFCDLKCFREHSKQLRCQERGKRIVPWSLTWRRMAGGTLCEKYRSNWLIYCDFFLKTKTFMNVWYKLILNKYLVYFILSICDTISCIIKKNFCSIFDRLSRNFWAHLVACILRGGKKNWRTAM